jgi:TetR/AcrR family transcriptional regulator
MSTATNAGTHRPAAGAGTWRGGIPSESELRGAKQAVILREAAQLIKRRGFHAASLDELAARLGVTKAALYHYFPGKQALLKACFDDVMAAAFRNLADARRQGRNGRERLRLTFTGYLQHIIDEVSVAVVTIEEDSLTPADRAIVVTARDRFERSLRELVRQGIRDGSIVPCDPKLAVFAMLGAVNWVTRWYRSDGRWSRADVAAGISAFLDRALSTSPVASLLPRPQNARKRVARGGPSAKSGRSNTRGRA